MQENTNKAIAYNTVFLYVRLVITAICALLTTRFALQTLGVTDFGLFSLLGSIISFMGIINTIMLSASNRYIAVAIGQGDEVEIRKTFSVNVVIHLAIAIVTLLLALPIGEWYIHNFVNYEGSLDVAVSVYRLSIIGSAVAFVGVPYNGLLMAKERFWVFCLTDSLIHIFKLVAVIALVYYFENKLMVYALIIMLTTALPTFVYYLYCRIRYSRIAKISLVSEKKRYKEIFGFSAWVAYGAVANVGKVQGSALLVNAFFNTLMNTALGVANTVNMLIGMVAQNVTKSIAPQITKSYAAGNKERCYQLMVAASKLSFFMMLLISMPFLVETEYLLTLWLGQVPEYAVIFIRLLIIDALLTTLNAGISEIIFASGKIKLYQIVVNTLWLFSIVAAYIVLKSGAPAYSLFCTYICFTVIVQIVRQWVLHWTLHFNNWILIKRSILPAFMVAFALVIYTLLPIKLHPILNILTMSLYLCGMIWLLGLNHKERKAVLGLVQTNKSNT